MILNEARFEKLVLLIRNKKNKHHPDQYKSGYEMNRGKQHHKNLKI